MEPVSIQEFNQLTQESSRIEAVKSQIEKDFGLSGFTFPNLIFTWEDLITALTEGIQQIRSKNNGLWMKVVYRVDLTEKQYRFIKDLGGNSDENLAKAIILREFQKIVTRENYGKDPH